MSRSFLHEAAHDSHGRILCEVDQLDREVDGIEAADYLRTQMEKVERLCIQQAQAYPSNWWLLLLRHISPIVFACNSSNYASYRGYTEYISALSNRRVDGTVIEFPVETPQVKRCLRLAASCALTEDMSLTLRCVNRGARLIPSQSKRYKLLVPDSLGKAIERYDRQLQLNQLHGSMSWTGESYFWDLRSKEDDLERALVCVAMPPLSITPESLNATPDDDVVQFFPEVFVLNPSLSEFRWEGHIAEQGLFARVFAATMRLSFVDLGERPRLWQSLHETGLTVKRSIELEDYLKAVRTEANNWGARVFPGEIGTIDEDAVERVLTISNGARSRRYFGPALRHGPNFFCLDLTSATLQLEAVIAEATAGGGPISGQRARSWEHTVQAAIDGTPWKPRGRVRDLISRRLKLDGKVYTDVDAVAAKDQEIIIVSCKSWQLSHRYWLGDFGASRNKDKDLIEAARKLHLDIQKMADYGDRAGFAFSESHSVRGVVCISMPLLLTQEMAETLEHEAPGIEVVTLPELEGTLAGDPKALVPPARFKERAMASYDLSHRYQSGHS